MAVNRAFNDRRQFLDGNGDPYSGAKVFWYVSGSSAKQDTFTTYVGSVANSNPMVLDSAGRFQDEVWLTAGVSYKMVLAPSADTDPPASPIWTEDNIDGINDTTVTIDQWIAGPAPTYIGTTSFSLVGDQTTTFHVGRRVRVVDSGGTKYGTILTSAYTSLTAITLDADSDALATPTSSVSYGILSAIDGATPANADNIFKILGSADATKKIKFEVDGLTTATTRTVTVPDADLTIVGTATTQTLTNKTLTAPIIAAISSAADETPPVFNDAAASREIIQGCWAWVKFDGGSVGAGAPVISAAFNVASITDGGTGRYTINFTTALPNANYAVVVQNSHPNVGSTYVRTAGVESDTYAAGSINIETGLSTAAADAPEDGFYVSALFFCNP